MYYNLVITSGYFDPIHVGHIEYLRRAKQLGERHLVIVNNDEQARLKKGRAFMLEDERIEIVKALKDVDEVTKSIDLDGTVCETLNAVFSLYRRAAWNTSRMAFCKGGDRFTSEIPEAEICRAYGVSLVDGLGKKIQSSSALTGLTANLGRQEKLS